MSPPRQKEHKRNQKAFKTCGYLSWSFAKLAKKSGKNNTQSEGRRRTGTKCLAEAPPSLFTSNPTTQRNGFIGRMKNTNRAEPNVRSSAAASVNTVIYEKLTNHTRARHGAGEPVSQVKTQWLPQGEGRLLSGVISRSGQATQTVEDWSQRSHRCQSGKANFKQSRWPPRVVSFTPERPQN